eukprot:4694044-Pleurochrysis_carterae.AAC.6
MPAGAGASMIAGVLRAALAAGGVAAASMTIAHVRPRAAHACCARRSSSEGGGLARACRVHMCGRNGVCRWRASLANGKCVEVLARCARSYGWSGVRKLRGRGAHRWCVLLRSRRA